MDLIRIHIRAVVLVALVGSLGASAQEQFTDVSVQWAAETKLFPNGEVGRFYPGETLSIKAWGRIDRNHDYHEDCHTEWLVVKKCHDVSRPVWVNYADHPLVMAWVVNADGTEKIIDRRTVPATGLTVEVPKVEGKFDDVLRIAAFIPNRPPVEINRAISYGAYQFTYDVDVKPRLKLLKEFLKAPRDANTLRDPKVLNRRLREAEPLAIALQIIDHAKTQWSGNTNITAREELLRLAQGLAPGNRDVSTALSAHYLTTGNFVAAELEVSKRLKSSQQVAASPNATTAQLNAAATDAEELGTIYEKRGGLVGGRDVAAAEFWFGEAVKLFTRAKSTERMNSALSRQANILLRIRTLSSLQKATTVLGETYAQLPSSYRSPNGALVKELSRDGRYVHLVDRAPDGLLIARADQDDPPARLFTGDIRPVATFDGGIIVVGPGADDASRSLKFIPVNGEELRSIPLPLNPEQVVPVGSSAALVLGKQGAKQQLWRLTTKASSKVLELDDSIGFLNNVRIKALHAASNGRFAAIQSHERLKEEEEVAEFTQILTIYGSDNAKLAQARRTSKLDLAAMEQTLNDPQKYVDFIGDAGEMEAVAISPTGTHALALWKGLLPSRTYWMVMSPNGALTKLQVPEDERLLEAIEKESESDLFPPDMRDVSMSASPLLTNLPAHLPPQGWAAASFTPDSQRIVVSNWIKGILVFDLEGRLLDRIVIPTWTSIAVPSSSIRRATVVPFGHIWRSNNEVLVAGAQRNGPGMDTFLLRVHLQSRKVDPVPLSRSSRTQLANWRWERSDFFKSTPLLIPQGTALHVISQPGETHVLRTLPSFEELGRITMPYGDKLQDVEPVNGKLPTESGLVADLRTGRISLGANAPPNPLMSFAAVSPGKLTFVDILSDGTSERLNLRDADTGRQLASFVVSLPKRDIRYRIWGHCMALIEGEHLFWKPTNPLRQLIWVRLGEKPAAGTLEWKDVPGNVVGLRCDSAADAAVLLKDSNYTNTVALGWQRSAAGGSQPAFEPLISWSSEDPESSVTVQQSTDASRLLVTKSSPIREAFVFGRISNGAYNRLAGPFTGDSVITDDSMSTIGVYKDGRVALQTFGTTGPGTVMPVDGPPVSMLNGTLYVRFLDRFTLWPIPQRK